LSTRRHTRGEFLKVVGAGSAWIALLNTIGCQPAKQENQQSRRSQLTRHSAPAQPNLVRAFRSRPDLSPPAIEITAQAHDTAPGYIFIAPKKGVGQDGPMIVDDRGQLVWFSKGRYALNFRTQDYKGRPVLTWWQGKIVQGHGQGEYLIFDESYREMTRVRAGNGYAGDEHEFLISPQDTALITVYNQVPRDLSSVGGPKEGIVWEGVAQELDIETGEVLFEWHSLDYVSLEESYDKPKDPEKPFDYFHINSIDVDHDGNWIICARNTSAVYKIDRNSGRIIWRLGGKKSDFEMESDARPARQHDARRQPDGTLTIFDNGAHPWVHDQSRGIVLDLDEEKMSASLARVYTSPEKPRATSQGNMQMLPNGNALIGWGSEASLSEFSSDSELLFNANLPGRGHQETESYRAFRFPWSGHPAEDPSMVAEPASDDNVNVYASWNGATEVATWEILAGSSPDKLKPVGSAPRDSFETLISLHTTEPYVAAQAKGRSGELLGTAKVVNLRN
jgi:hypothetical protein